MTSHIEALTADEQPTTDLTIREKNDAITGSAEYDKSLTLELIELLREKIRLLEKDLSEARRSSGTHIPADEIAKESSNPEKKGANPGQEEPDADGSDKSAGLSHAAKTLSLPKLVRYIKRIIAPESDPQDETVAREDIFNFPPVEDDHSVSQDGPVISWRRTWLKDENKPGKLTLLIESSELRAALKNVVEGHIAVSFDREQAELQPPYSIIYHHRDRLREYGDRVTQCPPKTLRDIDILLKEVENEPQQRTLRNDARKLSENEEITHDLLWTLYHPGQLVNAPVNIGGERQDHICLLTWVGEGGDPLRLDLESIDYDGDQFKYMEHSVHIKEFKGTKHVAELEVVPLAHYRNANGEQDQEGLKEALRKRGRRFVEMVTAKIERKHFNYEGAMISEGPLEMVADTSEGRSDGASRIRSAVGEDGTNLIRTKESVIVDHQAYYTYGNKSLRLGLSSATYDTCSCSACRCLRRKYIGKLAAAELGEEQYIFCPPRVFGFNVKRKEWVQMLTENVKDLESKGSDDAFNKLELDDRSKNLLKDLVKQHDRKLTYVDDLVPGKGRSLIALLHGPPGVGKTLTAESLALLTGKPLYTLSMSDIGSTPSTVEQNLVTIFELTAHWKALLLFDEADIFLEKRSIGDLSRNGLVSVFIRLLEYYDGILFLTTNRVRTFDEAFQSRIQVALQYEDLTPEQCKKIWSNWLEKAGDDVNKTGIETYLSDDPEILKLNGRQIRNAFKSAVALAKSEGPYQRMEWRHLDKVLKNTFRFKQYMQQTNRQAEIDGLRWQ